MSERIIGPSGPFESDPALQPEIPQDPFLDHLFLERPTILWGSTYRAPTITGTAFITINREGETGHLQAVREVLINIGRADIQTREMANALGYLITELLNIPTSKSNQEILEKIINMLRNPGKRTEPGVVDINMRSLPEAIAQVLEEDISQTSNPTLKELSFQNLCPSCRESPLATKNGCNICYLCGYSSC